MFTGRAAEIIRYSNAGWSAADATAFGSMMNSAANGRRGVSGERTASEARGRSSLVLWEVTVALPLCCPDAHACGANPRAWVFWATMFAAFCLYSVSAWLV